MSFIPKILHGMKTLISIFFCLIKASAILRPSIFDKAYGSFVFSKYPDSKSDSLIGILFFFGYMQELPSRQIFLTLYFKA